MPDNCTEANTTGRCKKCDMGFFLNENDECIPLPDNCTEVNTTGRCKKCDIGFFLN